ncbi:MAG: bifunctional methylenetetrahydrofolate dehydrogenase/methenyltetrahydrofolate cyclohydrolase FolD [Christensenellaceae bacterium]|nr:bifunctional methylenetetrahydrofolate dehydrogenase/methenyltetrahydrofolate cyclohydrolase FolD [Christensenellaceae bacterium]
MMQIIDGKALSAKYREKLKSEIQSLKSRGVTPGLAVILVGDDPGSQVYVRNKIKACEELGITGFECRYPADTDEKTVIAKIEELNANPDCDGILVQLPLPRHLDERKILSYIDVKKDVDGFSAYQTGLMCLGTPDLLPCTPHGVIELIKSTGVEIAGKNAVVIGRNNIVDKPMFHLLLQNNATVTVCHSKTRDLGSITSKADILVVAIGKAKFVKKEMVKEGAIVIDVGMDRDENGKLCGDVDFEDVKEKCSFITPVPGGVGPMTITMLMSNTVAAANRRPK